MFEKIIGSLEKKLASRNSVSPNGQPAANIASGGETAEDNWKMVAIEFKVPPHYWGYTASRNIAAACHDVATIIDECLGGGERIIGGFVMPNLCRDNRVDRISIVAMISTFTFSMGDLELLRSFRWLGYSERAETVSAFLRHPRLAVEEAAVRRLERDWEKVIKSDWVVHSPVGVLPEGVTISNVKAQVTHEYEECVKNDIRCGEFSYDYNRNRWIWIAVEELDCISDPSRPSTLVSMAQHLEKTCWQLPLLRAGYCSPTDQFHEPVFSLIEGQDVAELESRSQAAYGKLLQLLEARDWPVPRRRDRTAGDLN